MTQQTAQNVISILKANFDTLVKQVDSNCDGKINRQELLNLLLCNGVDWCSAQAIVAEIFCNLDKNGDGNLSKEEVCGQRGCIDLYANKVTLVSPANGTVYCHFPRNTQLVWNPVVCATSYKVEVEYQLCGNWYPFINQTTNCPYFCFDFIGAQEGRWRVTALDNCGNVIATSDYWCFTYRV